MRILVTGAAGYIGSVVTEQLVKQGHRVIAVDNLQNGFRAAVHPDAMFIPGDLLDAGWICMFLKSYPVDAVVHLAAEALVDVSMRDPGRFFRSNVTAGLNLLEAMVNAGVLRIVFSSTAAVYGEPVSIPVTEDSSCAPVNSYGESKLAFERILEWYRKAYGLKYIALRYFNACGATELVGEAHTPETHIIPLLFEVALGQRELFHLYGTDYDTFDGSCLRDYVHVVDIAQAHRLALEQIDKIGAGTYNMGNQTGYSNKQVIEAVERVTGKPLKIVPAPRRPGDPARLVASSERIRQELGWQPHYPDLLTMVQAAWSWRVKHPNGYSSVPIAEDESIEAVPAVAL